MKVQFIRPNVEIVKTPMPIGVLYVAAKLREVGDYEFDVVDARKRRYNDDQLREVIRKSDSDIVGITAMSLEHKGAHQIAALAKEVNPRAKVVVGGPYSSSDPNHVLKDPNVDFVITGEGEQAAADLFEALREGDDVPQDIRGVCMRDKNGNPVINTPGYIEDLDTLPLPAWDLINMDTYFEDRNSSQSPWCRHRVIQVVTSRGCPYGCTYCHELFGKTTRFRSNPNLIEEFKRLQDQYQVHEVELIDDIWNLNRERAKEFLRMKRDANIKIDLSFPNGLRADIMDEELVDLLAETGCSRVIYAVESASPRIQRNIKKHLNIEKTRYIIDYSAEKGLFTGGFFMVGFPGETIEEAQKTVDFMCNSKLHTAQFFFVTVFPGTPMAEDKSLSQYTDSPGERFDAWDYFHVNMNYTDIPDKELDDLRVGGLRQFMNLKRRYRLYKALPRKQTFFVMFAQIKLFQWKEKYYRYKRVRTLIERALAWVTAH